MQPRWFTLRLLILSLLLLSAQVSVAVHSIEHPFHQHVASCDVFLAAQSATALCNSDFVIAVVRQAPEQSVFAPYEFHSLTPRAYSSRAPPVIA